MAARRTHNPLVIGSNPVAPTNAVSSKGRTLVFGTSYLGSNPSTAAKGVWRNGKRSGLKIRHHNDLWVRVPSPLPKRRHRLTVRTPVFQAGNTGSTPVVATREEQSMKKQLLNKMKIRKARRSWKKTLASEENIPKYCVYATKHFNKNGD